MKPLSNVTKTKIFSKLDHLERTIGFLRPLAQLSENEFLGDSRNFGAAERFMQLSIEIFLDIGKITLVSQESSKPETNREIRRI